jgi:hypothetical protein
MITKIKKRDGREVAFNIEKIANAILKLQVCQVEKTTKNRFCLPKRL